MSLCEWDPEAGLPAVDWRPQVAHERCGCPHEAVVVLGARGDWHLCATCAELPQFRRYRVAQLLRSDLPPEDQPVLRRDSRGWWAEDRSTSSILGPPRPLAEVLAEYVID